MGDLLGILFGRVLFEYVGKSVLHLYFKLFNDEKTKEWLEKPEDEMSGLSGGCFVSIIGAITLIGGFILVGSIINYFFY